MIPICANRQKRCVTTFLPTMLPKSCLPKTSEPR
jgi:hypothetical protein